MRIGALQSTHKMHTFATEKIQLRAHANFERCSTPAGTVCQALDSQYRHTWCSYYGNRTSSVPPLDVQEHIMSTVYLTLMTIAAAQRLDPVNNKRTVIITGGNRGVGFAAAKLLAATDEWNVILACRSVDKAEAAKLSIEHGANNVEVLQLDLSDLQSVKSFARRWGTRRLDCLALNAGIHTGNISTPKRSAQGFEAAVATNHIGHFYLTQLLLKNVERAKEGRIVYTASSVHNPVDGGGKRGISATLGDLSGLAAGFTYPVCMIDNSTFNADKAYKDSKLCNVLTTLHLARYLQAKQSRVTCNCFSPGLIPTTGLFREYNPYLVYIFAYTMKYIFPVAVTEDGGRRLAYMIASAELKGVSGKYYSKARDSEEFVAVEPSEEARNVQQAAKLWELTNSIIAKLELNP